MGKTRFGEVENYKYHWMGGGWTTYKEQVLKSYLYTIQYNTIQYNTIQYNTTLFKGNYIFVQNGIV